LEHAKSALVPPSTIAQWQCALLGMVQQQIRMVVGSVRSVVPPDLMLVCHLRSAVIYLVPLVREEPIITHSTVP
tara:strand:+ start:202 stop:423 length:222 start_codon:yes stop_codon:yes gene_type:complete